MPPSRDPAQTIDSFLAEFRNYLRDYPELNRLIDGEETSDRQLRWFLAEVLDDYANTPPPIGYSGVESVPRSILIKGVLAETLRSVAILNLRNSLRYTDGQVTVDLDKHQQYLALAELFWAQYEKKRDAYKVSQNINQALDFVQGAHSEYLLITGFFGTYDSGYRG